MRRIGVVLGVVALALLLAGGVALAATFTGTEGPDRIVGTAEDDTISALGGNDRVKGRDGDDTISGGKGDDALYGRTPSERACSEVEATGDHDRLHGGSGNDWIIAGYAGSLLFGGGGRDFLSSLCGDSRLFGGARADDLSGGEGDDWISGGSGNDDIGADPLVIPGYADSVRGGTGVDMVKGGFGPDTLFGEEQSDALGGEEDDDTLVGGGGADLLVAERGIDEVSGGTGDDILLDGALDLEIGEHEPNVVPYMFLLPPQLRDLYQRFEGCPSCEVGTGWGAAVDVEQGGPGQYDPRAPHDTFSGGDGDDRFYIANEGAGVKDTVSCGRGRDTVYADGKDKVASDCEKVRRSESDVRSRTADGAEVTMERTADGAEVTMERTADGAEVTMERF